ncbi:MAG: hypothetical protein AAFR03_00465 [Pseudomonadota bacterium]
MFFPGRAHAGSRVVHQQQLWSGLSVCGPNKWNKSDLVGCVSFELSNHDPLYDPNALNRRLSEIAENRFAIPNSNPDDLIEIECEELKIAIYFGFSSGGESFFSEQIRIRPNVSIDFKNGVTVEEAVQVALVCTRFFSFSIASPVVPKHTSVFPLADRRKSRQNWREFLLFVPFPKTDEVAQQTDPRDSAWFLESQEVRAQLSESLKIWMDRRKAWEDVYELIDKLLRFRPMISGDRLETAFKIVEKIPLGSHGDELWASKVDELETSFVESEIATRFSERERNRIINRIQSLKEETGTMLIERLFDHLKTSWPKGSCLSAWFYGNLREAWSKRGKTAHGRIIIDDKDEFTKLTFAAETFAIMLVACELNLGDDPVRSLCQAKLMTYIHGHFHAQPPNICQKYEKKFPKYA